MPELQDILFQHAGAYAREHPLSLEQWKVVRAIQNCRTAALGGHVQECDHCGYTRISYNSCRNRHCPKCQTMAKERWIEAQKSNLLQVGYFHIVFTLPEALNSVTYQNPAVVYTLLFKAASETLTELAADRTYLGAQIGITAVLHTWGQNLMLHPHVHCIVPGGGLTPDGRWVNSRKKFFLPVKVLSRKFRGKFLCYLKQATLEFHGSLEPLRDEDKARKWMASLYQKEWVVYCKPPFRTPAHMVEYLGRYTHRVAISNHRIVGMEDDKVTFRWRDYRDGNRQKEMTLAAQEFIRRFLMHVLPKGFTRIRHYGLLSPRNRKMKLPLCRKLTKTKFTPVPKLSAIELLCQWTGKDVTVCPSCGTGHLMRAAPIPQTA